MSVVAVVIVKVPRVVDVVAEEAGRIVMTGTEAAVVGQTIVALGLCYGQAESEVVAREWPDARVVFVHMRLETTSFGIVAAEVYAADSVASAPVSERLQVHCSGIGWAVRYPSFRPETGFGFEGA